MGRGLVDLRDEKREVDRVDLHSGESYHTHTYLAACLAEQHICRI